MKTLDDSNEDETHRIHFHFRKLINAITSSSLASTAKAVDFLQGSAMTQSQKQCGTEFVRDIVLGDHGVTVSNQKLHIDVATLFYNMTKSSKGHLLIDVFREQCASKNIRAALCCTEHIKNACSFRPYSEINIYGEHQRDNMKLAFRLGTVWKFAYFLDVDRNVHYKLTTWRNLDIIR